MGAEGGMMLQNVGIPAEKGLFLDPTVQHPPEADVTHIVRFLLGFLCNFQRAYLLET